MGFLYVRKNFAYNCGAGNRPPAVRQESAQSYPTKNKNEALRLIELVP